MSDYKETPDIIWSPYTDGHHPMYLRVLLESMAAGTARNMVIAVGSDIVSDPRWPLLSELIVRVNGQVIFLEFDGKQYPCDSLSGQIKQRNQLVALLARFSCNRLYIPFCDSIWFSLWLLGIPAGSCNSLWLLWMRNQSHLPGSIGKKIVERMKIYSAKAFRRKYNAVNYTVDPCFYIWSTENTGTLETYRYIPEPVLDLDTGAGATCRESDVDDEIVILAIGVLDERKDLSKLINAFNELQGRNASLRLIGPLSEGLQRKIEMLPSATREKIFILNATVTDEVYCKEMCAADIIWNVRSTHLLSSGTLANTIARRKVVICSHDGCTGYWGRKYQKAVICIDNPLEALNQALDASKNKSEREFIDTDGPLPPFTLTWVEYL